MRWFGTDPLQDLDAAIRLVDVFSSWRTLPNPGVRWALQIKGAHALIGTCGLFAWNRRWRKCALGYELGRGAQGQAYMHEALTAALDWGFENMELNRVEAQVHPSNAASLKSLMRLGFTEEGCLREVAYWGGEYHNLLQFSVLRNEWKSRPPNSIRR